MSVRETWGPERCLVLKLDLTSVKMIKTAKGQKYAAVSRITLFITKFNLKWLKMGIIIYANVIEISYMHVDIVYSDLIC